MEPSFWNTKKKDKRKKKKKTKKNRKKEKSKKSHEKENIGKMQCTHPQENKITLTYSVTFEYTIHILSLITCVV